MRKFIVWFAEVPGPRLVEAEASSPEEVAEMHFGPGSTVTSQSDPFGYGATGWSFDGHEDHSIVEVTSRDQRAAFALGYLDFMLEEVP